MPCPAQQGKRQFNTRNGTPVPQYQASTSTAKAAAKNQLAEKIAYPITVSDDPTSDTSVGGKTSQKLNASRRFAKT